jgi:hypothetical protein
MPTRSLAATYGALGEWARAWRIDQGVHGPDSPPNQLLNAALTARLAGDTRQPLALFQRVEAIPGLSPRQQATLSENFAQLLWDSGQQKMAQRYWRQAEALLPSVPEVLPTAAITRAAVAIQRCKPRLAACLEPTSRKEKSTLPNHCWTPCRHPPGRLA